MKLKPKNDLTACECVIKLLYWLRDQLILANANTRGDMFQMDDVLKNKARALRGFVKHAFVGVAIQVMFLVFILNNSTK